MQHYITIIDGVMKFQLQKAPSIFFIKNIYVCCILVQTFHLCELFCEPCKVERQIGAYAILE